MHSFSLLRPSQRQTLLLRNARAHELVGRYTVRVVDLILADPYPTREYYLHVHGVAEWQERVTNYPPPPNVLHPNLTIFVANLVPPGACSGGGREAASSKMATHSSRVGLGEGRRAWRMSRTRSCTAFQRLLKAALSAPRLDLAKQEIEHTSRPGEKVVSRCFHIVNCYHCTSLDYR